MNLTTSSTDNGLPGIDEAELSYTGHLQEMDMLLRLKGGWKRTLIEDPCTVTVLSSRLPGINHVVLESTQS